MAQSVKGGGKGNPAPAAAAPAADKSDTGTLGGEWILLRRDVAATACEGRWEFYLEAHGRQPLVGFAPAILRAASGSAAAVSARPRPGLRDEGVSGDVLASISAFADVLSDPWIALVDGGDGGQTSPGSPDGAAQSSNAPRAGPPATREGFRHAQTEAEAIYDAPWKTCRGAQVAAGTAGPRRYKTIGFPGALPARASTDKEADPDGRSATNGAPFVAPSDLWNQAAAAVASPPELETHLASQALKKAAHAHWAATKEIAVLETRDAPLDEGAGCQGRAQGYKTANQTMKSTPGRAHLKDPEAAWWPHSSSLIARYTPLAKNAKDVQAKRQRRRIIAAKLDQHDSPNFHAGHFGTEVGPTEVDEWMLHIAPLGFCDEGDLRRTCAATQRWAGRAVARAVGRVARGTSTWLMAGGMEGHPGEADPSGQKLEAKLNGSAVGDPCAVMNWAASSWRQARTANARDERQTTGRAP
ncbi:unnamed protein product, partial [Prorocentrum cordatum]